MSSKLLDNPAFFVAFGFFAFSYCASLGTSAKAAQNGDDDNAFAAPSAAAFFSAVAGITFFVTAGISGQGTELNRNTAWLVGLFLFAIGKCADLAGSQVASADTKSETEVSYPDADDAAIDGPANGFGVAAFALAAAAVIALFGAVLFGRQSLKVAGSSSTPSVWFAFLGFLAIGVSSFMGGTAAPDCSTYSNVGKDLEGDALKDSMDACGGPAWASLAFALAALVAFTCAAVCTCYKEDLARTRKTLWGGWFAYFTLTVAGVAGYCAANSDYLCRTYEDNKDVPIFGETLNYQCQGSTAATVNMFLGAAVALVGTLVAVCSAPNSAESPSRVRLILFHFAFMFFFAGYSALMGTQGRVECYYATESTMTDDATEVQCSGYTGASALAGIAAFTSLIGMIVSASEQMPVAFVSGSVNGADKV